MIQLPGLILIVKSYHVAIMHIFQGRELHITQVCFNSNTTTRCNQINAVQIRPSEGFQH